MASTDQRLTRSQVRSLVRALRAATSQSDRSRVAKQAHAAGATVTVMRKVTRTRFGLTRTLTVEDVAGLNALAENYTPEWRDLGPWVVRHDTNLRTLVLHGAPSLVDLSVQALDPSKQWVARTPGWADAAVIDTVVSQGLAPVAYASSRHALVELLRHVDVGPRARQRITDRDRTAVNLSWVTASMEIIARQFGTMDLLSLAGDDARFAASLDPTAVASDWRHLVMVAEIRYGAERDRRFADLGYGDEYGSFSAADKRAAHLATFTTAAVVREAQRMAGTLARDALTLLLADTDPMTVDVAVELFPTWDGPMAKLAQAAIDACENPVP